MRDYVFVTKDEPIIKATLRTDIIEDGSERFTIMWLEGVQGTIFEKIMPFKPGTVTTKAEMEEWFETYQGLIDGYIYGGEQVILMGAETFDLTITPTITGATTCKLTLSGTKEGAEPIQDTVDVNTGVAKVLKIIDGFEYKITLPQSNAAITSGDPGTWTADADKAVALEITVTPPN